MDSRAKLERKEHSDQNWFRHSGKLGDKAFTLHVIGCTMVMVALILIKVLFFL